MSRRHSPWSARAILIAAATACSDGNEPSGPLLLGEWGSDVALLIAINSGAELQLGCSTVIIGDPIELDGATFAVEARVRGSMQVLGDLPKARVTGSVSGPRVVFVVTASSAGPGATYDLEAGVKPDPMDVPQCPL